MSHDPFLAARIDAQALANSVQRYLPQPFMLPHGIDPASVDFRTFFPYNPSEVKHRKRTTRSQLKVLEDTFKRETKPNNVLRKSLASQLGMTPRGVQVWFQNRRAKQKGLEKKARSALSSCGDRGFDGGRESPAPDDDDATADDATPPHTHMQSPEAELSAGARTPLQTEINSSMCSAPTASTSRLPSYSPLVRVPEQILPKPESTTSVPGIAISRASWNLPSSANFSNDAISSSRSASISHIATDDGTIQNFRRGSLPTHVGSGGLTPPNGLVPGTTAPPPSAYPTAMDTSDNADPCDPLARRASIDRLAMHPFAHIAVAANGAIFGPSAFTVGATPASTRISTGRQSLSPNTPFHPHAAPLEGRRPELPHRQSVPVFQTPTVDVLSPTDGYRMRFPADGHAYVVSSRNYAPPVPGPLPVANYTFGAPAAMQPPAPMPPTENETYQSLEQFSFPPREEANTQQHKSDRETEEASISSYACSSRFGSLASIASSETSVTSNFYSEHSEFDVNAEVCPRPSTSQSVLNMPFDNMGRKMSSTSMLLDKFSHMNVRRGSFASSHSNLIPEMPRGRTSFSGENTQTQNSPEQQDSPMNVYPSSSSTLSGVNGRTPENIRCGNDGDVLGSLQPTHSSTVSHSSSELASALQELDPRQHMGSMSRQSRDVTPNGRSETSLQNPLLVVQTHAAHSTNDVTHPTPYVPPTYRSSYSDSALPLTYPVASSSTDYTYHNSMDADQTWTDYTETSRDLHNSHPRAYGTGLEDLNLAFEPVDVVSETGHYSPVVDQQRCFFDFDMPSQNRGHNIYQSGYGRSQQSFSSLGESGQALGYGANAYGTDATMDSNMGHHGGLY